MPSLFISSIPCVLEGELTLDIGFKFPDVGPRNLGINNISLGGDLSVWRSRKSNIPIDRWFINYLKTFILARVLLLWAYSCQEAFVRISLLSHKLVPGKHRHYRYGISYIYHQSYSSFHVQSTYSIKVGSARFIYHFSYAPITRSSEWTHNTNTPLGEGSPHLGLLVYGSRSHVGGVL